MAASGSKTLPGLGFFTVMDDASTGLAGGLLVLNAAGRPLEFHCTAPLKPNRAQEILYGPTLKPFLYGEQIGATLATKARSDTLFLCTDLEPAMCLRHSISTPLVLVGPPAGHSGPADAECRRPLPENTQLETPPAAATYSRLECFFLGRSPVAVLHEFAADQQLVQERWQPFVDHLDLWEPFSRIRDALSEAQRGAAK